MTYLAYGPARKFSNERLRTIMTADEILKEYDGAITLRGLYYQFVARGLLPNVPESYNKLKFAVSHGRKAGLISWTAIEDTLRQLRGQTYQASPRSALQAARASYRLDKWIGQLWRPEIWVEKDAQVPTLVPVCLELGVDFMACRGYASDSMAWRAGRRFAGYINKGQRPIVFHLGDHDPSGQDMTRDNRERLELYAGVPVQVVRLALNMDQVERYKLPPNPLKRTDDRADAYEAEHGDSSWELDALAPDVIRELIRSAVLALRDPVKWDAALAREAADLDELDELISGV